MLGFALTKSFCCCWGLCHCRIWEVSQFWALNCNSHFLFFFYYYCASFYSGFKVTLLLPVLQDFGIPVAQSIRVTAPKEYSASGISHFIKVLHGAPIFFDGTDPFSLTEVPDNLALIDQLLKEDQDRNHCFVLPSSIDHESAGDGLYSGI